MKKNVLIVNNTLGEGGAEKVLVEILDKFDYNKYNVNLLLLKKDGVHFDKLNKNVNLRYIYPKLNIQNTFLKKVWNWFEYRSMKHLYKFIYMVYVGFKNDVEIAFLEGDSTLFVSRSINKQSKKIAWVHTDLIKCRPTHVNEYDKEVYKYFDDIICVSNSAKESFKKLYSNISCEPKVIYNLIDVEKIKKMSDEKVDFEINKPTIISVGRLVKLKRFDLLIKAHKIILDNGIDHDLLILGNGEEKENLQNLIDELKVNDSVKMLGFKHNPYPYIKKSSLFVLASEFEGLPLVVCEALSLGIPIISTINGGGNELLADGEFGIIVNTDDLEALSEGIKEILVNKYKSEYFKNKSKDRVKVFDTDKVLKEIYEVIG